MFIRVGFVDDEPPPDVADGETFTDYYARTKASFWIPLTQSELAAEGKEANEKKQDKIASKMAEMFYKS